VGDLLKRRDTVHVSMDSSGALRLEGLDVEAFCVLLQDAAASYGLIEIAGGSQGVAYLQEHMEGM
jgi:hypothetical protein